MASKLAPLPAGAESATRSYSTATPTTEGASAGVTASTSAPFSEDTGDPRPEAIDSSALEFEFDAIRGTGRYETGALLGTGGMGEVRLTLDQRIGRRVARKTMRASRQNAAALRRFLREARVQGQLEHPAILPVYDLDVGEDEQVYFTMKRIRGETLERVLDHLRRGDAAWTKRFGARKLLSAFAQVCLAVDYAHSRRVVHRDLKPGNVMLGSFGEVYLLDWGLAKVLGGAFAVTDPGLDPDDMAPASSQEFVVGGSGAITAHGALLGTLGYMAPEQLAGRSARIDTRTDVYALGAILFEILTLTRFRAETSVKELLASFALDEAPRPSQRVAAVPPELDELCARALAVKSEQRPRTARELAEAVERYLDGEHDSRLRRELAARHAATAQRCLDTEAGGGAGGRVEAMREAMKALALDADQPEAQRLLLEGLTNVSGEVPAAAQPELDAMADRPRRMAARTAMQALLWWLAVLPFVVFAGVLSWPFVGATAAVTLAAVFYARHLSKKGRFGTGEAMSLAGLVGVVVALTSCYLGPFAVTPTSAAGAAMVVATSAARRERWIAAAIFVGGGLLPFVTEVLGIGPRAYDFEPGRIVVHARAIALPHWPTMGAMAYSMVACALVAVALIGRQRDALAALEQRQLLQAWYLRQLFPARGGEAGP